MLSGDWLLNKSGQFRFHSPSNLSLSRGLVTDPWSSSRVELLREMMEDGSRAAGDRYVWFCLFDIQ